MEKIGIFGGTFNPPHAGHLHLVSEFIKTCELDRMLIIPTYVPPHKVSPELAPTDLRVEMCRCTFTDPVFEISTVEIDRKGRSYTYDTLRELKGIYKNAAFYFLCGDDMLLSLHKWYRSKGILQYCTVVAAVRSDACTEKQLEDYARIHYPAQFANGRIRLMPMNPLPLSSTEIRQKRKNGESIEGLVTEETRKLIESEDLYR